MALTAHRTLKSCVSNLLAAQSTRWDGVVGPSLQYLVCFSTSAQAVAATSRMCQRGLQAESHKGCLHRGGQLPGEHRQLPGAE